MMQKLPTYHEIPNDAEATYYIMEANFWEDWSPPVEWRSAICENAEGHLYDIGRSYLG